MAVTVRPARENHQPSQPVEILSMDRRQLMRFEDALHRSQAHPRRLCQQPASPVCGFARWRPHRQIDDLLNRGSRQRRLSRLTRLVACQPGDAFRHEAGLPAPHDGLGFTRAAHDLGCTAAIGRGQDDVCAPHVFLGSATIRNNRLKLTAIRRRDPDNYSCSHIERLNCI